MAKILKSVARAFRADIGRACTYSTATSSVNVFDRNTKLLQRKRAASAPDSDVFDYLKEEVGYRLSDRVFDIKRKFNKVVDLGCGKGHASKHLLDSTVEKVVMSDSCQEILEQASVPSGIEVEKVCQDEETFSFPDNSIDLFISNLSLHWVNDLPGAFDRIMKSLKSDGVFIGSIFGGETLYELRSSLQLAEIDREGGFGPHISPFTSVRDVGGLLNRSGFTMLTIDADELVVNFPTMFELMWDLKGMGENNATWTRRPYIQRDTLMSAASIYKEMYGNPDGTIPATFQVLYFIGWKPDTSQPKPLPRGSGNVSMKDIYRLDEIAKETKIQPDKNPYNPK